MKGILLVFALLVVGGTLQPLRAQQPNQTAAPAEAKTIKLEVKGMTCAGCANHISQALQKVEGVLGEDVQYPGDVAFVTFLPDKVNEKAIIAAIEKAGYKARILESPPKEE